jgi:hypothetical protein
LPVIEVLQKEETKMKIFRMSRMFWKLFPSLGLMTLFLMAASAWANGDPPVPFGCTGDAYTVRAAPASLFRIDQSVSPFVFQQIGGLLTGPFGPGGADINLQVNNLGYDTIENLLYAVAMPVSGNFNYGIIKIDSTGKVFPVASGLRSNVRFLAGDVSTDGTTFYINTYPSSTLEIVDLGTLVVTQKLLSVRVNVADWAFNPADGKLYGAVGQGTTADTGAKIYQLNPVSGMISEVGQPPGLPLASGGDAQYYGGAWFDAEGHLFVYRNSDYIYHIDLDTMTILDKFPGGAGSSQLNDAAACAAENPGINKFYTHTNNDWSDRCVSYLIVDSIVTDICETYRLPNTYLDDDIFANPLDQINDEFVLFGQVNGKKTVVTPGQYIAVSNIKVITEQDVWVVEDFSDCTDIGSVNPFKVPGGVQVVLIDANGDVYDIDDDLALGIGGFIELTDDDALVHVDAVPAGSTLRVMVKFMPDRKVNIGDSCTNHEILFDEYPGDPGEEIKRASAVLTIVEQD